MSCSIVNPVASVVKNNVKKVKKPSKYLKFAETVNSRSAMQGVVWGGVNYLMTGHNIVQQLYDPGNDLNAVVVTALVAAGSAITLDDIDKKSYWSFTPDAEIVNGRAAMLGFIVALLLSAASKTQ